jgi:hypothetical protein
MGTSSVVERSSFVFVKTPKVEIELHDVSSCWKSTTQRQTLPKGCSLSRHLTLKMFLRQMTSSHVELEENVLNEVEKDSTKLWKGNCTTSVPNQHQKSWWIFEKLIYCFKSVHSSVSTSFIFIRSGRIVILSSAHSCLFNWQSFIVIFSVYSQYWGFSVVLWSV